MTYAVSDLWALPLRIKNGDLVSFSLSSSRARVASGVSVELIFSSFCDRQGATKQKKTEIEVRAKATLSMVTRFMLWNAAKFRTTMAAYSPDDWEKEVYITLIFQPKNASRHSNLQFPLLASSFVFPFLPFLTSCRGIARRVAGKPAKSQQAWQTWVCRKKPHRSFATTGSMVWQ